MMTIRPDLAGSSFGPPMGLRPRGEPPTPRARLERAVAAAALQLLMPSGRVNPADLERPRFVEDLLRSFSVTTHPLDQEAFRQGFAIAQAHPERVARLAFDIDEVYLHWSFSLRDMFRGVMERGVEASFHNTAPDLLDYRPFQVSPDTRLRWYERIWFHGIQRLFPSRFRQHLQFHPGIRAFQLGLRLGQERNLIMVTTGPAGKILRIANEDPAMKMIYFGKRPTEPVSIEAVRSGFNIYTRENLVLAWRELEQGAVRYPNDALVTHFLETVRQFPSRGVKLKHPAIARLLGKRPFSILVDDSASTYAMLREMPGFSVLKPPSARPSFTLNFTLGAPRRYLDRMANGYVRALAEILSAAASPASQELSNQIPTPENYPLQRLAIEIPWGKFGAEFVQPARELELLGRRLSQSKALPPSGSGALPSSGEER